MTLRRRNEILETEVNKEILKTNAGKILPVNEEVISEGKRSEMINHKNKIEDLEEKLKEAKDQLKYLIGEVQKECSHENMVRVMDNNIHYSEKAIKGWFCRDCGYYRPVLEGGDTEVCRKCGRITMEFVGNFHAAADIIGQVYRCSKCCWETRHT